MSETVIKVENLSKQYRIGTKEGYRTFRETLVDAAKAPFMRLKSVFGSITDQTTETKLTNQSDYIWALKDISFEVKRGEVVGIIGRNGAGKSTLLKILSKITEPTKGRVELRGRVGSLLEVGTGFHPELTGHENVYLYGAILGMDRWEVTRKFDEIVAFAELEKFIETPVKRYSSGMYMRLAFAVSAFMETEILLVDEVLAVGDAAFQKKCLGKMGDVSREGRTVLFVSHNMGAINVLCKKTMLLDQGSIVLVGESPRITEAYLTRQVSKQNGNSEKGYSVNSEAIARQQKDELRITELSLFNPKKPELGARTGDPLLIRINYNATCQFQSPAFVVSFKDLYGEEVVRLSTMPISGYRIESLFSVGRVDLLIEYLPLVAGHYYLDIGFVRESVEWVVKLENVLEFDIQGQDVYGSGLFLDRSRGLFVVEHTWDHKGHGNLL